jgi:outer membrane receptor protein involved in Fe transport
LIHTGTANNCAVVTVVACPNIGASYRESGETHKAELKWQLDPAKMVYFLYSTGFRPGGNNRSVFQNGKLQNVAPYQADTLSNYELGWKTSWFDHTLYVNGAVFWEDWSKVQYSLPGVLGIFYTVNAGDARSRGIEASVTWKATHALTLSFNGTFADTRLTTPFCDQQHGCDPASGGRLFAPAGTRLPVDPRIKMNGNARYSFEVGNYDAYVMAGFNTQTGTLTQLRTDWEAIAGPTGGFTTFDLSGGLSVDRYTLTAYVNNMFDRRGVLGKNDQCAPSICGPYLRNYITKPQEFGLKVGYKF